MLSEITFLKTTIADSRHKDAKSAPTKPYVISLNCRFWFNIIVTLVTQYHWPHIRLFVSRNLVIPNLLILQ